MPRARGADVGLLACVIKTLVSSIGIPTSAREIVNTITFSDRDISINTVDRYLNELTDSYLFYKADQHEIKNGDCLSVTAKYYLVDTGLCHAFGQNAARGIGSMVENVVYLELLRRGYHVNIGNHSETAIDFVATTGTAGATTTTGR